MPPTTDSMSYYGDGDDDADLESPVFSRKTWVGIVVPLCVVAGIVLIALIFFYRRRRQRQRRNGVSLNQQGRLALERDILEDGYGGVYSETSRSGVAQTSRAGPNNQSVYLGRYFRGSNGVGIALGDRGMDASPRRASGGRGQPRTANRWAWAHTTDLTTTSREMHRMEGLNELGEAPPPYEAPKKLPKRRSSDDDAHHTEHEHEHEEREDRASVEEGVTVPTHAHIRQSSGSASGSLAPERSRSIDGDTIAATVTTTRTATTTSTAAAITTDTATETETASRSRPESSASLEGTAASLIVASSLASSSSVPSTVVASLPASPPAYSERTAANRASRS